MNIRSLTMITAGLALLGGCVSPEVSNTRVVQLDDDTMDGGISSRDVRTVASKMAPAILSVPEVANAAGVTRIKLANMKNSTRFFIDRNIFMKKLRQDLNRYGEGRVRFIDNNENTQSARTDVLEDRIEEEIRRAIAQLGSEVAASALFASATMENPVKIAVVPVLNANMVNMNADSFAAMLRSEIVNAAGGRIQFLLPGATDGADYWLTGQFYPESLKKEGIINLAEYIDVVDARVKDGKSLYLDSSMSATATPFSASVTATSAKESILLEMLRSPAMQAKPNVNKHFNMMIVKPETKVCVYEKNTLLDRKISGNSGRAEFVLSGEISGLSQARSGVNSDYLNISFQLVEPVSNEIVWEDAYEIKRVTTSGIVYQ